MATTQSIGEAFDPIGAHLQDPYAFYARARREEPVFWSPHLNAWVVTRADDIRSVLRQPEVLSSANALRPGVRFHPETLTELGKGYPPAPQADGGTGTPTRGCVPR